MKIHKLIELWRQMEQEAGKEEEKGRFSEMNPEELLNVIQFLDRQVRRAGYHCTLREPDRRQGTLRLSVTKDGRAGGPVEVKLWDNQEHRITGRFSLRRRVTDENGFLCCKLPCGSYDAEIGCGPEYTKDIVSFEIREGEETCVSAGICRGAHLTENGWLAGDLHHHSIYSSPAYGGTDPVIETPGEVCASMKALGMQFGALSDHHNTLNHEEWERQTDHFTPILSKEISTSNGHVLSLGVREDVIYDIPRGKERTDERLRGEFVRVCGQIREQGGLPQVNHPFDTSFSTRFNSEFLDMIGIFESMEIWNGASPFTEDSINGMAFHAWLGFLEQGIRLTATAGSDTHNIYGDDYFGMAEWIGWLMETVIAHPECIPEAIREKTEHVIRIYREIFPGLVRWVEHSNSPANVCNYVYTGGKTGERDLLSAIRAGRVFVSNGPLLVPTVNRAGIGGHTGLAEGKGELRITLLDRQPLRHLYLYTSAETRQELALAECRMPEGFYDYSVCLPDFDFGGAAWAVFVAEGGPDNTAVTNPIYFGE